MHSAIIFEFTGQDGATLCLIEEQQCPWLFAFTLDEGVGILRSEQIRKGGTGNHDDEIRTTRGT